jgi:hypothetical protein
VHLHALLKGYRGIVQCDGYAPYKQLPDDAITLAFCWAHVRRGFFEIARKGNAPIATQALLRIAALYKIEEGIRGKSAEERRAVRQQQSTPHCEALKRFLEKQLGRVSAKAPIAQAIRYALKHWEGLTRFLNDGRIDLDSNIVERSMRPQGLTRKNALFAGHDNGAENWAIVASLIETALCRARHRQVYADRRTMPNGVGMMRGCRGTFGLRVRIGSVPFGIVRPLTALPGIRAGGRWRGSGSACRARTA